MLGSSVPTYEQLSALPTWESLTVQESQIDDREHMNIRFYFDAAAKAVLGTSEALGFDGRYRQHVGADVFTTEHRIRYFTELRLGDAYSTRVQIDGATNKALSMTAYIVDESHRRLACAFKATLVNVDLTTRRAATFSPDAAQRIATYGT